METPQIIIELTVIGVLLVIGFLSIKLGLEQDENKTLRETNKSLKFELDKLSVDLSSLYGKYLNCKKEIKKLSSNQVNLIPSKKDCKTKKDFITALNEMNNHSKDKK